jgi:hypothetical protein
LTFYIIKKYKSLNTYILKVFYIKKIKESNIMKTTILKNDSFSLTNQENYKKDLEYDLSEIINKYAQLIIEYSKFIHENIKIKNNSFYKFIIIRGLDTITHVFNYILYFTKNLDLTYYHCQKSFYFYIEFVGQITEEDKKFLNLTTRDATNYVYKKTIFEMNDELKRKYENNTKEFEDKIDIILIYIKVFQTYLLKIVQVDTIDISKIDYIIDLTKKINQLTNKYKISILEKITEKLFYKIENIERFFEINSLIIKLFLKNPNVLDNTKEKLNLEIFDEKILESNEKFVNWLIS